LKRAILAVGVVLAVVAPSSQAAPRETLETVRHGIFETANGTGCSTVAISTPISGSDVVRVQPEEGDLVGSDAAVLRVDVTDDRVTWTIGPTPSDCSLNASIHESDRWTWKTWDDASWRVLFRDRLYAITASPTRGVREIAGFRVTPRGRSYTPTLGRARQALGRPTSVRRGRGAYDDVCWARWARLGLRATFLNLGLGPACRYGPLQLARVEGAQAHRWVAAIGRTPGTMVGTSLDYLEDLGVGGQDSAGRRLWTLAERYLPYGSGGYVPTVSAIFTGSGRLRGTDAVRGFDLYIGAAGD
jgi:hypothetical protein